MDKVFCRSTQNSTPWMDWINVWRLYIIAFVFIVWTVKVLFLHKYFNIERHIRCNIWCCIYFYKTLFLLYYIYQPFSIFLLWRNPWNNFQVSGNPCIKNITSTAHGTLAWSVSCRYNNPIIIVSAVLSRELYFSVDLYILANKFKNRCLFFSVTISRGTPSDISRNPGWETLMYT
jgi:hypothetical protein